MKLKNDYARPHTVRALIVGILALLSAATSAEAANPYEGFKVPPLNISSETRYSYQYIEVLGSKMAYVEAGNGDPILFLHGQPTSSYLWRNIMPHLEGQGRVIAPDNIGFGQSDQPDLDYTFGDQYRYFDAFVKKLKLRNITLVVHDWGSGLGLHYARLNPGNVKAIVTMESIIAPLIPAESYSALPEGLSNYFRFTRAVDNDQKLIKENFFIENTLPGFIVRPLSENAHDVYRAPFVAEKSRMHVNQWPREMPIGQQPKATHDIITAYNLFLEETNIPWLFLYSTPGALNTPEAADYWSVRAKNIETAYIGTGLHYLQEDQPYAIGRAISDFYRRIEHKKTIHHTKQLNQNIQSPKQTKVIAMNNIVWPEGFIPGKTDNYVSNEIILSGLNAVDIWPFLNNTAIWPSYYSNVSNIKLPANAGTELKAGMHFSFTTFGIPIEADILEYEPPMDGKPGRLAWHGWAGEKKSSDRIDAYHAWLIEDLSNDRVRILTQETQNGEPARNLAKTTPNPMLNAHQEWVDGLGQTALKAKSGMKEALARK